METRRCVRAVARRGGVRVRASEFRGLPSREQSSHRSCKGKGGEASVVRSKEVGDLKRRGEERKREGGESEYPVLDLESRWSDEQEKIAGESCAGWVGGGCAMQEEMGAEPLNVRAMYVCRSSACRLVDCSCQLARSLVRRSVGDNDRSRRRYVLA